MDKNKSNFDVIISGGGLSGCLMALSLAKLTKLDGSLLSIAIVEANQVNQQKTSVPLFDDRVLALSHGSAAYLEQLSVWQHLSRDACAIEKIDISDRGHYGKARLEAPEHGVSALGYVIEMALIGKGLLKELATKSNVHWFSPDGICNINWQSNDDASKVNVELNSGQSLEASLLLACDGANSPCRQMAGIKVSHSDYQQVALIANVATEKSHQNKAFERFTDFGPIAMLPLTELNGQSRCSLVWTMTPEQSEAVLALSDEAFKQQLEQAFGSWLGAITHVGKRDVYPLVLLQAQQQTYHRMALVGNASHTIHPIAGQGFNLGLRDVQLMADLLESHVKTDSDMGNFALLNEYAMQRQVDQKQVIELTDSLVTFFANDLPPLIAGRNIGLKVMNYFSPLKNALVNKLMGY
ncbi:MAG: 2-octaprenyl-6-methoxyphenyl hydroxylase [Colwellia sp.]|nr:2-octaprenyl-6-methoxyphenyl hydroxylase [Colwellia sp.]MCW8865749.1 2-octaprenyl-6-methoxyphenyl hydroxylase [Colwellia sp.]MCW9081696.1 2-octaprenyl-6-methoxyphenyl hydroxylase [Colwellia sp.]